MKRRLDLALALVHRPRAPVPRRADDGPRPVEPRRPVGGGRPARARRRRHGLPHHPVPRGGRRARRPRRDHRPRAHRRRGHAGGAEGGDRPPVASRSLPAERARARRRRGGAAPLRRAGARAAGRRRRAPRARATTSPRVVRALDAAGIARRGPAAPPARRSTTSSWPRPAASSRARARSRDRRGGARSSPREPRARRSREMARRSILQTLRQPALVVPPIVFPLRAARRQRRRAGRRHAAPRLPDRRLPGLRDRVPVHPGRRCSPRSTPAASLARDVETGFLKRLALTPMQRAALLLGHLAGVMAVGADLGRCSTSSVGVDRRRWTSRPAWAACSC